jgi:transposase
VPALSRIRGISTVTAFSIAAEAGDFARFPHARPFMP